MKAGGRVVVVSDTTTPIGAAIALAFAQAGERVVACGPAPAIDEDLSDSAGSAGVALGYRRLDSTDFKQAQQDPQADPRDVGADRHADLLPPGAAGRRRGEAACRPMTAWAG